MDAKSWPTNTKNVGAKRNFHTLDWREEEADTEIIEQGLSQIEGAQAILLSSMVESPESFADRKRELAEFIAIMHFRVPFYRDYLERQLSSIVSSSARMLFRQGKFPEPPDVIKDPIEEKGDDIFLPKISNWKIVEFMFEASLHSQISSICSSMKFRILKARGGNTFITCDRPIVLFDREYENHRPEGSSFGTKTIEISFVLSPKLVVLATWKGKEGVFGASDEEVRRLNWRTIVNAQNYLYMIEISDYLTEDLPFLCEQNSGIKLDELDFGNGFFQISRNIPVHSEHFIEIESEHKDSL